MMPLVRVGPAWSEVHERFASYAEEAQRFARVLERPARVLDMACGGGDHAIQLARLGHACVASDRSLRNVLSVRDAARRAGVPVQTVCADMSALPFGKGFELVLCVYALGMARSDAAVIAILKEARRVLVTGGRLIFNVINATSNVDPRSPTHAAVHRRGYLRDYTRAEILQHAQTAGLVVERVDARCVADVADLDLLVWAHAGDDRA